MDTVDPLKLTKNWVDRANFRGRGAQIPQISPQNFFTFFKIFFTPFNGPNTKSVKTQFKIFSEIKLLHGKVLKFRSTWREYR